MKQPAYSISLIIVLLLAGCNRKVATNQSDDHQTINPLLGNISFVARYGHEPTGLDDEDLRIRTHLEYAEYLLRQRNASQIPVALRGNRTHCLDLLHSYLTAGIFPRNYDIQDRRAPCFIDKDGRICAVGYLVEQTAGRKAAEAINDRYKYADVLAMNTALVDNWIAESGLTKEEAAMIQPTYGYSYNHIEQNYGISSAIVGGINLAMNTMNAVQMNRGTGSGFIPFIGLGTGAGEIILGIAKLPKETQSSYTNESQKTLSFVNIGLGTTTVILSIWNLASGRKPVQRETSWNFYNYSTPGNNTGLALSYTRRF